MASLWDDIVKTIREGVDTVVEKTGELTRIGKIRVDILNIKRNVEKSFAELGGRVYHIAVNEKKNEVTSDKEVKEIIECIKILEKELDSKKSELEKVKSKDAATAESKAEASQPKAPAKAKSSTRKPAAQKTSTTRKSNAAKEKTPSKK